MNEDAMRYLCELSTHFHLNTVEDWHTFFDLLGNINNTGCAYPSVMKSASFPKQDLNAVFGTVYADTDSAPTKVVKELTVLDVMRMIEDNTRVCISTKDSYYTSDAIYIGIAQEIPTDLYDKKVSKFTPDYLYSSTYHGLILDIIICN